MEQEFYMSEDPSESDMIYIIDCIMMNHVVRLQDYGKDDCEIKKMIDTH